MLFEIHPTQIAPSYCIMQTISLESADLTVVIDSNILSSIFIGLVVPLVNQCRHYNYVPHASTMMRMKGKYNQSCTFFETHSVCATRKIQIDNFSMVLAWHLLGETSNMCSILPMRVLFTYIRMCFHPWKLVGKTFFICEADYPLQHMCVAVINCSNAIFNRLYV